MKTVGRSDGRTVVTLAVTLVWLTVFPSDRLTAQDTAVARLTDPRVVHNRERSTTRDDAAIVQALEHRIKCTCGCGLDVFTCRTTDFTCATSPAMHRAVLARLDSSMTADQVVAAFEAQYGQSILMQPPKRGFNWAAYLMPFAALGVGLFAVLFLMRRWTRGDSGTVGQGDGVVASVPSPSLPVPQSPELERLARELEHFEA